MKKIIYILSLILLFGCNSENASDCFQSTGDIIQQEFQVSAFTEVTVFENVELFITQGAVQQVILETGTNLMNDVEAYVENGRLIVKDNNGCNLTRDYGITKAFVTTPNLTQIRNSSNLDVNSIGILNFEDLKLVSEDDSGNFYNVGNFNVALNCTDLFVVINNFTTSTISGTVENLRVNHASGDGRFEGRFLVAQNVRVYHRGTNDIIVNPQLSLTASLVSTGDVISVAIPENLDVTEQFDGRVIFE